MKEIKFCLKELNYNFEEIKGLKKIYNEIFQRKNSFDILMMDNGKICFDRGIGYYSFLSSLDRVYDVIIEKGFYDDNYEKFCEANPHLTQEEKELRYRSFDEKGFAKIMDARAKKVYLCAKEAIDSKKLKKDYKDFLTSVKDIINSEEFLNSYSKLYLSAVDAKSQAEKEIDELYGMKSDIKRLAKETR